MKAERASIDNVTARILERFQGLFEVVRHWVADSVSRGDARADVNPDRLIELIGGATLLGMMLRPDDDLGGDWAQRTADIITHGVMA